MRARWLPVGADAVCFPKAGAGLKNHALARVVGHVPDHEALRLGPSRRHRDLPEHDHRDAGDQVIRFYLLLLFELAAGHGDAACIVPDGGYRAAEVHAVTQPLGKGIGHALIAALDAKQAGCEKWSAAQLLDSRAPDPAQSRAASAEMGERCRGSTIALQKLQHRDFIESV